MNELEIENRLTTVEQSVKSAHHRIDTIEATQKEIRDLTLSVNTLAGSVKSLCEDVADVTNRVKCIEAQPAKRWDQLIGYILAALASGAIGFLLKAVVQ